jgi:hypothetical protein
MKRGPGRIGRIGSGIAGFVARGSSFRACSAF